MTIIIDDSSNQEAPDYRKIDVTENGINRFDGSLPFVASNR